MRRQTLPLPILVRQLEELLAAGEPTVRALAELAPPQLLDTVFRVLLGTYIRRGPSADANGPSRLLAAAGRAAEVGIVPISNPRALRRALDDLARELRSSSAWRADVPLWWEPVPAPSALENRYNALAGELGIPTRAAVTEAFAGPGDASCRMLLPSLVPADTLQRLAGELERLDDGSGLCLERAGVGAGRISARRSDSVAYLSGLEPTLLDAAPTLAAFIQLCLDRLPRRLAAGNALFAPQTAMLARYPAPSGGYAPHLDNPGGDQDNARSRTLVIYLNPPQAPCRGGELALWTPGTSTADAPAEVVEPRPGSAALFDARRVPHQVRPLLPGPPRWALTVWLSDEPQRPEMPTPPPPNLRDALLAIADPPLPQGRVLTHALDLETARRADMAGEILIWSRAASSTPRVGLVATVYRGGKALDAWCAHHFGLGFDHLVLIFDRPEESAETADLERLRAAWPAERLSAWEGPVTAKRWDEVDDDETARIERAELERLAAAGASPWAVAARQTLNANVALAAARTDALGGAPLDWMLHLDADELFYLEGDGRGGATLAAHFEAAQASGIALLRYLNHEILEPEGGAISDPSFKCNPRLAAARLGGRGFAQIVEHLRMAPEDERPYFRAYHNGKSAVAVAAARAAAGVHGWTLHAGPTARGGASSRVVAGPSVLHFHAASPADFRHKYLDIAHAPEPEDLPFEASPVQVAAVGLIRTLEREGASEEHIVRRLDALHRRLTHFTPEESALLDEAGLLLRPQLEQP